MKFSRRIKLFLEFPIVIAFLAASIVNCDNHPMSTHGAENACNFSDVKLDSLMFHRDQTDDSLLFEQIRYCQDLPRIVLLKLDLLTSLERFRDGLLYIDTLDRDNFEKSYDSLIYRTFFESKLTVDREVKIKMFKTVTDELGKHLLNTPLDTLALSNYCLYSLKYQPSEFVFKKIDSMAFANKYNPTYEFVIFLYFPERLSQYQKRILL
jgi:hypothetical protein